MKLALKDQRGYTLIELLTVVGVIGVLAAIALPAYQSYVTRTQVSEAIQLLSGFKSGLAEFYANRGAWPTNLSSIGAVTVTGKYVSSMSIISTGPIEIQATFGNDSHSAIIARTVLLTSSTGLQWTCVQGGGTPIDNQFLPEACR